MFNESRSIPNIESLRKDLGVRTLFVAYGGSYTGVAVPIFDRFAKAGSCDVDGSIECEDTIVASTPQKLKEEIDSKIRQIIADRLSFSAPSITATLQEGGSIYQAQFNYEQNGEWRGRLLRKQIKPASDPVDPGGIADAMDPPYCSAEHGCNWDAGKVLAERPGGSETRNIWTAMPAVSYIGNWNNFTDTDETRNEISALFNQLDFNLVDYYDGTAGQRCPNLGEAGTADELRGLISFMRGADYFDYNGDCDITEIRDHVQGDIYHSQLIEIGSPDGNTQFTDNNQEAYYRTINNYQNFRAMYSQRRNVLYLSLIHI